MTDYVKKLNGVYKGIVYDNKDPKSQNRIKVTLEFYTTSKVASKQLSTDWIYPMMPANVTTPAPKIGQGVWVMFQAGDPAYPLWFGEFGKHQDASKKLLVKPLQNSVSLSGITDQIITVTNTDGTVEVDLTATLIAIANKLATLQTNVNNLHTTLATKTSPSHTHTSAG